MAVELLAYITILLTLASGVLQIAAVGRAAVSASNAARAGSRAAALERSPAEVEAAADNALAPSLRPGSSIIARTGTRVTVAVAVPIVIPGLTSQTIAVVRTVELPD